MPFMCTHACMWKIHLMFIEILHPTHAWLKETWKPGTSYLAHLKMTTKAYMQVPKPQSWILQQDVQTNSLSLIKGIDNPPEVGSHDSNTTHIETTKDTWPSYHSSTLGYPHETIQQTNIHLQSTSYPPLLPAVFVWLPKWIASNMR